jgi:hypothetical protein
MDPVKPCSADGRWKQRVKRLVADLKLDGDGLAKALREASKVAKQLSSKDGSGALKAPLPFPPRLLGMPRDGHAT